MCGEYATYLRGPEGFGGKRSTTSTDVIPDVLAAKDTAIKTDTTRQFHDLVQLSLEKAERQVMPEWAGRMVAGGCNLVAKEHEVRVVYRFTLDFGV